MFVTYSGHCNKGYDIFKPLYNKRYVGCHIQATAVINVMLVTYSSPLYNKRYVQATVKHIQATVINVMLVLHIQATVINVMLV